MTYYSILAIFPALAALVAIYGIFTDPGTIAKHMDDIVGFVPSGAIDVAREQLTRVASKGDRTLGFTFATGLANPRGMHVLADGSMLVSLAGTGDHLGVTPDQDR